MEKKKFFDWINKKNNKKKKSILKEIFFGWIFSEIPQHLIKTNQKKKERKKKKLKTKRKNEKEIFKKKVKT